MKYPASERHAVSGLEQPTPGSWMGFRCSHSPDFLQSAASARLGAADPVRAIEPHPTTDHLEMPKTAYGCGIFTASLVAEERA